MVAILAKNASTAMSFKKRWSPLETAAPIRVEAKYEMRQY